jgi:hypothetical protein
MHFKGIFDIFLPKNSFFTAIGHDQHSIDHFSIKRNSYPLATCLIETQIFIKICAVSNEGLVKEC